VASSAEHVGKSRLNFCVFAPLCFFALFLFSALEVNLNVMRAMNSRFTFLLTYFAAAYVRNTTELKT